MKDYTLKLLYSGSDGNAALLLSGEVAVLIDAGKNAKALCTALLEAGVAPERLSAIFLTHEHRDHTSALDVFLKKYPVPVHTVTACAEKMRQRAGDALLAQLVEHPPLFEVSVGNLHFHSFPTPHDSEGSVGYRITVKGKEATHTIGYATDLGAVTPTVETELTGCEAVVIECNHDEAMLREGPYPADLKRRIASRHGHLSNPDCAALCARLSLSGTKRFLLAHLSETNNLPELALGEVKGAVGETAVVRTACPFTPTEL